jgi:hypothetical protein
MRHFHIMLKKRSDITEEELRKEWMEAGVI